MGLSCSRVSCVNSGATGQSRSGWCCSSSAGKTLAGGRCDAAAAAACLEESNMCKRPWKPPASSVDTHTHTHTQQEIIRAAAADRQPRCNSLPPSHLCAHLVQSAPHCRQSTPVSCMHTHLHTLATAPAHARTAGTSRSRRLGCTQWWCATTPVLQSLLGCGGRGALPGSSAHSQP